MSNISIQEFKQRQAAGTDDFFLVDVRESYEHEEFNVGGELIPLGDITTKLDQLGPHRDEEIVVYCRSGKRSGMAQTLLQQSGFKNVRNLEGGMLAYQQA